jgi:hypothetical protein
MKEGEGKTRMDLACWECPENALVFGNFFWQVNPARFILQKGP